MDRRVILVPLQHAIDVMLGVAFYQNGWVLNMSEKMKLKHPIVKYFYELRRQEQINCPEVS
ncbi:hypothetical protein BSK53_02940 [Paenibacillus odorifer]|nr:hypothetical protein BSK53_02940 [Paenibacillus odorifer]